MKLAVLDGMFASLVSDHTTLDRYTIVIFVHSYHSSQGCFAGSLGRGNCAILRGDANIVSKTWPGVSRNRDPTNSFRFVVHY